MTAHIRPWKQTDFQNLVQFANNTNIWNNLRDYFPHPYTDNDARWWLTQVIDEHPSINFAIDVNGIAAGGIGVILNSDVYKKSAEVGYWLGQPFWGRGIATEAVKQITHYTFSTFDVVRIYAQVFETNKASMKVLEKNGYQLESIRKKAVYKNDVLMDDYVWVKLI